MSNSLNKTFTGVLALALMLIAVGRIPFLEKKNSQILAGNITQCPLIRVTIH